MAYAAVADIQARLPGRTISSASKPTSTQVTAWITEAEAELDGTLLAAGLSAPYATASAVAILKRWVADCVEGRVRRAHASAGGDDNNNDGRELVDEWNKRLEAIVTGPGPARYGAMLGASTSPSGTVTLRASNVEPAADDYLAPEFERDMEL